ncbi:ankyrin, partial [Viridothelium virens]
MTSLHLCAYYGLPSFIPLLAATFPANINAREHTYGQTPLHYACRRGHLKTVQALLSCGADVNLIDHGYYDRTPLILAVELGRYEMVKSLLAHPNIAINQRDVLGCTALWHAATRGLEDITKVLLDQPGVEINTKDIRTHKTPLICAAENDSGDVVAML